MTEKQHALFSPSGSHKWLNCLGSVAMEQDFPNDSSEYADEGTAAHDLASWCLADGKDAAAFKGRRIAVGHRTFEVDDEMVEAVQVYVDNVRAQLEVYSLSGAINVELHVEQAVPLTHITGERDAEGTADAVIIAEWPDHSASIYVGDLKYGRGIEVECEGDSQLQMYALGAVEKFGLLYEFKDVRMAIHQPRLRREPSEWEIPIAELEAFHTYAKERAADATIALEFAANWKGTPGNEQYLSPGEHCRKSFCRARSTCPALAKEVAQTVSAAPGGAISDDFDTITEDTPVNEPDAQTADLWLSICMGKVSMIEDWCKAVRAEVERRLLAGDEVPGYKLVEGRAGPRAWSDAEDAEKAMKSMRLKKDEMYDLKLISPTSAEKLLKDQPKRWDRLKSLITRTDGKPSVAPLSDKRQAYVVKPVADDFAAMDESEGLV